MAIDLAVKGLEMLSYMPTCCWASLYSCRQVSPPEVEEYSDLDELRQGFISKFD